MTELERLSELCKRGGGEMPSRKAERFIFEFFDAAYPLMPALLAVARAAEAYVETEQSTSGSALAYQTLRAALSALAKEQP
jgi:hypothetical protein